MLKDYKCLRARTDGDAANNGERLPWIDAMAINAVGEAFHIKNVAEVEPDAEVIAVVVNGGVSA